MPILEKINDLFLFRLGGDEDKYSDKPLVTTGSIVWGFLFRSSIIIALIFLIVEFTWFPQFWWISFFALWFFAAYPAWRQYQDYQERLKAFKEETLCGTCKHFEETSRMCRIYDEHVSVNRIPCEGLNWEPSVDSTFGSDEDDEEYA